MIEGFGHKTYEERLSETGLTTLVQRRKRGDLIETLKLIKGITHVDYTHFFKSTKTWEGDICISLLKIDPG